MIDDVKTCFDTYPHQNYFGVRCCHRRIYAKLNIAVI